MLAFALSFVMLVAWRFLFVKETPKPAQPAAATAAKTAAPVPEAKPSAAQAPPAPERVALPARQADKAQETVVENDLYRVTLWNRGAVVTSWVLKKYRDEQGKPLDVINGPACEKLGFPLKLSLPDSALADKINSALFVASPSASEVKAPAKLEFVYSDGNFEVKKTLEFGEGYDVKAQVSVFDGTRDLPVGVAWSGGFGDPTVALAQREAYGQAAYGVPGSIKTQSEYKLKENLSVGDSFAFAGLEDRYFVSMFLPPSPGQSFGAGTAFRLAPQTWTPPDFKEKTPPKFAEATLATSQPQTLSFRLFVAPKDLDVLRAQNPPLDGLVDFGWFSFAAKPLFLAMRLIYDHWVHNYGWAIVILTILINMALFPLKLKSIRSAQGMQKVAPIVKSIQDRYKHLKFNDPRKQRMNQEIMKIYSEHGVNPLSGCLPMLLQLPILYGFYRVLELPIELRHAPWVLWVTDLSAPDRLHMFGLPIPLLWAGMIVSMFILQKMTPMATVDPAQKRMMLLMPVVFGLMFINLASGLVLYFLVANIVGIAQQMFINKMMPVSAPGYAQGQTADARQ